MSIGCEGDASATCRSDEDVEVLANERGLSSTVSQKAQQGARANDHGCHAACYLMNLDMKPQNPNRQAARGAPAMVVAHL